MKKLALMVATALVATAAPAHAADWRVVSIGDNGDSRWSYDAETYTASTYVARFVARREYNNGTWAVFYMEVNCRAAAFRTGPEAQYSGQTSIGNYSTYSPWKWIATGTIGDYYAKTVCG